jgi:hypothetical protein
VGIAAFLRLAPLDIDKETLSRTHARLVSVMTRRFQVRD